MYAEIASALTSLKTIGEMTSLIAKAKTTDAVRENTIVLQNEVITLQTTIMSIQTQNQALLEEKDRLKQKVLEYENWAQDARNYELTQFAPGLFFHSYKPTGEGAQPPHHLCPNCYHNKKKSIVQRGAKSPSGTHYSCPACNAKFLDQTERTAF